MFKNRLLKYTAYFSLFIALLFFKAGKSYAIDSYSYCDGLAKNISNLQSSKSLDELRKVKNRIELADSLDILIKLNLIEEPTVNEAVNSIKEKKDITVRQAQERYFFVLKNVLLFEYLVATENYYEIDQPEFKLAFMNQCIELNRESK